MFGFWEILIILGLALIFIGPKKLPEIAGMLGRGLRDFRRAANELSDAVDITPRPDNRRPDEIDRSFPERDPGAAFHYDESPGPPVEPKAVEPTASQPSEETSEKPEGDKQ